MDERLTKDAGATRRGREDADRDRENKDGTTMSMEDRIRMLQENFGKTILPDPPEIKGFHTCWLSTTSNVDPVYKRLQLGYVLVKQNEVPSMGNQATTSGEFAGCVSVNEMVLAKIPMELYQVIMRINHYEKPLESETMLRENVTGQEVKDSEGKVLGSVEGFDTLGRTPKRPPTFA